MRYLIAAFAAVMIVAGNNLPAMAQSETWSSFVKNSPALTLPYQNTDLFPVIRGVTTAAVPVKDALGIAAIFSSTTNFDSAGLPGFLGNGASGTAGSINLGRKGATTANDSWDARVLRRATFSGGTVGNTNRALDVTTVSNAGITSYEWNALFMLDNLGTLADGSQNNAAYFQSKKRSTGATWATTHEIRDYNTTGCGAGSLHPCASAAPVGIEIDISANDADPSLNRTILSLVGMPLNLFDGSVTNTTIPTIDYGIKLGCYNADATKCNFGSGIFMGPAAFNIGIDLSQVTAFTSAALWLPSNHANPATILWGTSAPQRVYEYFDPSLDGVTNGGVAMDFANFGTRRFSLYNTGSMKFTDGTVDMRVTPLVGSLAAVIGAVSNHDTSIVANNAEQIRALAAGGVKMAALPASAGTGGLFVCVDSAGTLYKKATCP